MQYPDSDNSEIVEVSRAIAQDKRWLGVGIVIFMLVIVGVGGVGYLSKIQNPKSQIPNNKTEISTETPKESLKPVEQQNYTVEILNGSGVTGAAKAAEMTLKSQITNSPILQLEVTTGNAPSQTGMTISYKSRAVQESSLGRELGDLYPEASVKVMGELSVDARLVLGK